MIIIILGLQVLKFPFPIKVTFIKSSVLDLNKKVRPNHYRHGKWSTFLKALKTKSFACCSLNRLELPYNHS